MVLRKESDIVVNWVDMGLDHECHSCGRESRSAEATSEAKRWVSLWRVHCLNMRSLVCLPCSLVRIFVASPSAVESLDMMKLLLYEGEPMGTPRTRRP